MSSTEMLSLLAQAESYDIEIAQLQARLAEVRVLKKAAVNAAKSLRKQVAKDAVLRELAERRAMAGEDLPKALRNVKKEVATIADGLEAMYVTMGIEVGTLQSRISVVKEAKAIYRKYAQNLYINELAALKDIPIRTYDRELRKELNQMSMIMYESVEPANEEEYLKREFGQSYEDVMCLDLAASCEPEPEPESCSRDKPSLFAPVYTPNKWPGCDMSVDDFLALIDNTKWSELTGNARLRYIGVYKHDYDRLSQDRQWAIGAWLSEFNGYPQKDDFAAFDKYCVSLLPGVTISECKDEEYDFNSYSRDKPDPFCHELSMQVKWPGCDICTQAFNNMIETTPWSALNGDARLRYINMDVNKYNKMSLKSRKTLRSWLAHQPGYPQQRLKRASDGVVMDDFETIGKVIKTLLRNDYLADLAEA